MPACAGTRSGYPASSGSGAGSVGTASTTADGAPIGIRGAGSGSVGRLGGQDDVRHLTGGQGELPQVVVVGTVVRVVAAVRTAGPAGALVRRHERATHRSGVAGRAAGRRAGPASGRSGRRAVRRAARPGDSRNGQLGPGPQRDGRRGRPTHRPAAGRSARAAASRSNSPASGSTPRIATLRLARLGAGEQERREQRQHREHVPLDDVGQQLQLPAPPVGFDRSGADSTRQPGRPGLALASARA